MSGEKLRRKKTLNCIQRIRMHLEVKYRAVQDDQIKSQMKLLNVQLQVVASAIVFSAGVSV